MQEKSYAYKYGQNNPCVTRYTLLRYAHSKQQRKPMKLKITITMDNAAFEPDFGHEAARILEHLAADIKACNCLAEAGDHETLMDINGNRVGEAKVTR